MQTSLILGLLLHRVPSLTRPRGVPTLPRRHDNMQGSEWENYHVTCNTFESTRIIFLVNLHRLQTFWGKPDGCVIQIKLCGWEIFTNPNTQWMTTIDSLRPIPKDSNDKGVAFTLNDSNKKIIFCWCYPGWVRWRTKKTKNTLLFWAKIPLEYLHVIPVVPVHR